VTFLTFRFFISLLGHPLAPATVSEHRLACFFSGPPPCYIIPRFDAQTHPGSKSIILNLEVWGSSSRKLIKFNKRKIRREVILEERRR
jgi:hypothetical protein